MPRNNAGLFLRLWIVLFLLTTIILMFSSLLVYAAPPIDEIRTIIAQKSLRPQLPDSLAALDSKRLETGLRAIDQYARHVPSTLLSGSSSQPHLGIEVFAYNSRLWIRPDIGGPADKAGVPEVGELRSINGKSVNSLQVDQVSALLDRAVNHNDVLLTVSTRPGGKGKLYKVKPVTSQPSSVSWRRTGTDLIFYISEFISHDTAPGFSARLAALSRPGDRVVLDLRGCSGGDLYEALEIAGVLVPAGLPLVSTFDRSGMVQTYRSPSGKKQLSPSLVLIDHRTASAAEILAGILQYHHIARVVGEQSYGKCVSQTLFSLSDGGGLWLTTLGVNFPDNTSCTGSGIKPDISYQNISVTKVADVMRNISINKR